MNQILRLCFIITCCLSISIAPLFAQIENADALPKQFDALGESSIYWTPNLLQSNNAGLQDMARFHGFALNWLPRGLINHKINQINGIDWRTNLNGWDPNLSYAGLYAGFKTIDMNSTSSNASLFTKIKSVSSSLSNATTMQEIRLQWHTGLIKKSYWINVDAVVQKTPLGYLANGLKNRQGILFSIEKSIATNQQFGFSFWWSPVEQGKRAPTVQEVYTLTNNNLYNPSWGWLDGKPFYANTKKSNAPVMSLHYDIRTKKENLIQFNLGLVLGTQSSTQLDWSKAADPRPDYYKYLPSYAIDEQLKKNLLIWYAIHPEYFQIQFDQLKAKNIASANGAAKYIINEQVQQLQLIRFSAILNQTISPNSKWHLGLAIHSDQIGYSNQVANLLGAKYYLNYNSWVDDDGLATAFQNDLQFPDRKIKEGDSWGSNYNLNNQKIYAWTALNGATSFL